jgi:hypothetical protein
MKLSEFKNELSNITELHFLQTDGQSIPAHFHITEAGITTKQFIDCGGTKREEQNVSFQLWVAGDTDHRLESEKLQKIISIFEKEFSPTDLDIEIEYQTSSIGRFGLTKCGEHFQLTAKQTNCLAMDKCGIPTEKLKVQLSELASSASCCSPSSGCCS